MLSVYKTLLREWTLKARPRPEITEDEWQLCQSLTALLHEAELDLVPMISKDRLARIEFSVQIADFLSSTGEPCSSPAFCLSRSDFHKPQEISKQVLYLNPRHTLFDLIPKLDKQQQRDLVQLCLALYQWPMDGLDYPERLNFHWGVRVLGGPMQAYSKAISEEMWLRHSSEKQRPSLVLFPKNHGDEFSQSHLQRWSQRDNAVLAELQTDPEPDFDPEELGERLIYYSPLFLPHIKERAMHDLVTEDKWYGLSAFFSNTIIDRTETLKQSLKLRVLDPLPSQEELAAFDLDLDTVMIDRARRLLLRAEEEEKDIEVFWSGGIDSTAILAAFIQAGTEKQLKRVVARLDSQSIAEHPKFFRKIIQRELRIEELDGLSISKEMKAERISVTGECGDQIFGSATMKKCFSVPSYVHDLGLPHRFGAGLEARWQDTALATMLDKQIVSKKDEWLEWFEPQLKKSPIPIISTFDFLWWLNFSLKWQTVTLRCFNNSWDQLKRQDHSGADPLTTIEHFFRDPSFQLWSCQPKNHSRKFGHLKDWKSYKEPLKRFIFNFDKDETYYQYKEKVGSLKRDTELPIACPLMAIDDRHNPIYWGPHSLLNSQRDRKYKGSLRRFLTD